MPENVSPKPRRRRRWLVITALVFVILLVVIALLPTIASMGIARSVARDAIAANINGDVQMKSMKVGWFGQQRIEGLRITDAAGNEAANINIEVHNGLLALALGGAKPISVTVSGSVSGQVREDGSITFADLAKADPHKIRKKPPANKPAEPFRVSDLPAAVITVNGLSAKLDTLQHRQSLALDNLAGKIVWTDSSQPLTIDLHGKTSTNGTPGSLDITGQADQFVAADGTLTLRGASIELDVGAKSIPLPMLPRPTTINALALHVASDDLTERISLEASANGRIEGAARDTTVKIDGSLGKIIDGSGKPSFRAATAHLNADIANVPVMTPGVSGEVAHFTASIVSEDLTKDLQVAANGDGQVSAGEGAGQNLQPSSFSANLSIAEPFSSEGVPQIEFERITGTATGRNVPSSLAEGALAGSGIDPVRDIGPVVDVDASFPGGIEGELHVVLKGANANAEVVAQRSADESITGSKLRIDAPAADPKMIAGLTKGRVFTDVPLNVQINLTSFKLPALPKPVSEQPTDEPPPTRPLGEYAATGTLTVIPASARGPAQVASSAPAGAVPLLRLERLDLNIDSPALAQHVSLKGEARIGGGTVSIDQRITKLIDAKGELNARGALLEGTLKTDNLPVETIAAFAPAEHADLVSEVFGERLSANVVTTPAGDDLRVELSARGAATTAQANIIRRGETLYFERSVVDATVTPELAAILQRGRADPIVLGGPARVHLELEPLTLPMLASADLLSTPVKGRIRVSEALVAKAPVIAEPLAIPSFEADLTLAENGGTWTATVANGKSTLRRGESKRDIASLAFDGTVVTSDEAFEPKLNVRVTDLHVREAEALLGRTAGEIAQWTGDQGNVDLHVEKVGDDLIAQIKPELPNVQGDYAASMRDDIVSITAETSKLVLAKEALQARLNPPAATQPERERGVPARENETAGDQIRVEADVPVQLVIRRCEFPRQLLTQESFDPAQVNLDIGVTGGTLQIANPDGVKSTITNLNASLKAADLNKGVQFALKGDAESIVPAAPPEPQEHEHAAVEMGPATTRPDETRSDKEARREARREERREGRGETRPAETISTPPPAATQPREQHITGVIDVTGSLANLINSEGQVDIAQSRLQMDGKVTAVPTAVADALASMEGLLVAAVGPQMNATFQADDFSKDSGTLNARIDTTNGHVETVVHGREGSFRINKNAPLKGELDITRALRERLLLKIHPILADVHTTEQPVRFEIPTALAAIPADVAKLRAEMNISIGKVEFDSGSTTLKILTFFGEDDHSVIPGEIEPISAKIRNGVVTYDKFAVHIDKYTLNYSGQVDLVKRLVDVRTEIPLSALKHEIEELSGFADNMTVPLVTRGTFGNLKTMIDPDFDLGKAAIDAGFKGTLDQLLKGEGGLFKELFDKPKEKDE